MATTTTTTTPNIEDAILERFQMTKERYDTLNNDSTTYIKQYFAHSLPESSYDHFFQWSYLNPNLPTYWQFGVDKAGITDCTTFQQFCDELNIDSQQNILANLIRYKQHISKLRDCGHDEAERRKIINKFKDLYCFVSRDKKLVFTIYSNSFASGYFHWFNVTGEADAVKHAFAVYLKHNPNSDMCWGGQW